MNNKNPLKFGNLKVDKHTELSLLGDEVHVLFPILSIWYK